MKLTKILILLLAFWLEPLSASPYFSFKKYQVEDGLSHNTVWCAIQDSYGFIWLGTSDGLDSYVELYKGGIVPLTEYADRDYDRDIVVNIIVKKRPVNMFYEAVKDWQALRVKPEIGRCRQWFEPEGQ